MKLFFDDPKNFFERYSINLPGNPEEAGKIGQLELMRATFKPVERAKDAETATFAGTSANQSFHKFQQQPNSVNVSALAHNAAWKVDEAEKRATLIVRKAAASVKYTESDMAGMEWFLCLMLPWVENRVTAMKLRKETRADAFFTGQMNGCSFVVTGDPAEPFVSHINCNNADEYEDKYRDILRHSGEDTRNAKRIGREHYKLDASGVAAHEHSINERLAVQNRKLASPIITDTLCFVMGRLVKGLWEFFYQRVITQSYAHKERLGKTGGLVKFVGRDNREVQNTTVYRSISAYNKLWPDGSGRLTT
jgi:hypothetical protein